MNYFKNNKALLLIIAALIVVNLGLLYFGFVDKDKHRVPKQSPTRTDMLERTKKKLKEDVGFSDEQVKQYEALRAKHWDSIDSKIDELAKAKESFINLTFDSRVSDSSISAAAERVCEKQKAIDEQMLRHFLSVRQLATGEQRPKMDSFLQKITRKMSGKGRMGPPKKTSN
jgi:hypothetical protein